jgi:hypothetical protein
LKRAFTILLLLSGLKAVSQCDTCKYDRKEEIIDNDKRYAIHNNYLMIGGGFAGSSLRKKEQVAVGIDFIFHIKRQHFQIGVLMSGDKFNSNNNLSGHFGYCYRIEDENRNITFGAGISQNKGKIPSHITDDGDTIPDFYYRNTGIYLSAAYFKKITYDIGIGLEIIADINQVHQMIGAKAVLFFSGAYRGKAKIFNRYVKSRKK